MIKWFAYICGLVCLLTQGVEVFAQVNLGTSRMTFVKIEGGKFEVGAKLASKEVSKNEKPRRTVEVDVFLISENEISAKQFASFAAETSYRTLSENEFPDGNWRSLILNKNPNSPVAFVSWEDATAYCDWLSRKTGFRCGLPTEALWEIAAIQASGENFPDAEIFSLAIDDRVGTESEKNLLQRTKACDINKLKQTLLSFPSEWCQDRWSIYERDKSEFNPAHRVIRGKRVSDRDPANRVTILKAVSLRSTAIHAGIPVQSAVSCVGPWCSCSGDFSWYGSGVQKGVDVQSWSVREVGEFS